MRMIERGRPTTRRSRRADRAASRRSRIRYAIVAAWHGPPLHGSRRRGGRFVAFVAALALGVFAPAHADAGKPSNDRVRDALRAHPLHGLDGRTLTVPSLAGEVVVVNFWASWCQPCRRELPALDALNATLAKQGGRVLAISIDEDAENVRRFARQHRLRLPLYLDGPAGLAKELDLDHVPYTVVFDRRGEIAYATSGANPAGLDQLAAVTKRLAAENPPAAARAEAGQ